MTAILSAGEPFPFALTSAKLDLPELQGAPAEGHCRHFCTSTGFTRTAQLGQAFRLRITIRDLNLAQKLGRPYEFRICPAGEPEEISREKTKLAAAEVAAPFLAGRPHAVSDSQIGLGCHPPD